MQNKNNHTLCVKFLLLVSFYQKNKAINAIMMTSKLKLFLRKCRLCLKKSVKLKVDERIIQIITKLSHVEVNSFYCNTTSIHANYLN